MINKHSPLPFVACGYFFNPCRCVLFTLKLSHNLVKAHRVWRKEGLQLWNGHRRGNGRSLPQNCGTVVLGDVWRSECSLASSRVCWPRRFWANVQEQVWWDRRGSGTAIILTFLQSVESLESLTAMKIPSFGTSLCMADWVWIETPIREYWLFSFFPEYEVSLAKYLFGYNFQIHP